MRLSGPPTIAISTVCRPMNGLKTAVGSMYVQRTAMAAPAAPAKAALSAKPATFTQRAAGDHQWPRRGRDGPGAHVGAEPEERGRPERDVARRPGEHRPARRERDVHQTRERQRDEEVVEQPGQGRRDGGGAGDGGERAAGHQRTKRPLGRVISTSMKTP